MNKTVIGMVVALVVVVGTGFFLVGGSSEDVTDNSNITTATDQQSDNTAEPDPQQQAQVVEPEQTDVSEEAETDDPIPDSEPAAPAQPGQYIEYYDGAIADTSGTKLLFFHADWCVQCRALENDIKSQGVPDNVTFLEVDYDNQTDLRQKYGVTLQTTVVKVDDQGNEIGKYGAYSRPTLQSVIDNLL